LLQGFNSALPTVKKGGRQHRLQDPPGALLTTDPHACNYHPRVKDLSSMKSHKNLHDALRGREKGVRDADSNENRLFITLASSVPSLFIGPLQEKHHPN